MAWARSRVKVAMPQRRGGYVPTKAIRTSALVDSTRAALASSGCGSADDAPVIGITPLLGTASVLPTIVLAFCGHCTPLYEGARALMGLSVSSAVATLVC